ncbi:MAG: methylated-DNA--[protein]-cysteine S-methyltransferase [Gammaproteobacteria bacterium]|nr:methylated-DNA--[protein]-cysteine S-methyltransferase [Gammaproteobacteria bacterium]
MISAMSQHNDKTLQKFVDLARFIADNADASLTLEKLSARVHLSPSRMQRVFKSIFGVSPKKFQQAARSERFRQLLRDGTDITDAIFESGYGSTSRVYGQTMHNIGMTPKSYRAGGAGERISWACRDTVLGPILMAATDRGVCFAQFGDDRDSLVAQLQSEFSQAELQQYNGDGSQQLDQWIDALNGYIQNKQPRPELPLDLRGTAFQIKVWEFLLSLQDGDVISYSELAQAIDKPTAVRAAAGACGANRVAVLVPCHRILRGDGGLGGYRWGLARKRALLDAERMRKASTR